MTTQAQEGANVNESKGWKYYRAGEGPYGWDVCDAYGLCVVAGVTEETARRIVAAVNAVESIPTSALEAGALGKALEAAIDLMKPIPLEGGANAAVDCYVERKRAFLDALRSLGRLP